MPEDQAIAFESLYNSHFVPVRNFLRIYLGDSAVVEDVAQDTFLQFWQSPNAFDPARSSLRAYLFGIARKKAADWWRKQEKSDHPAPEAVSPHTGSALLLSDALQQLSPDLRNVLWLREVEGYSYDELAAILGLPVGTVKSRLFSAREQLRHVWQATNQTTSKENL
jgi:RNA polymerase sigma-70 factor (ECF subfamily)